MKLSKKLLITRLLAVVLIASIVTFIFSQNSAKHFAKPDKKIANGSIELCSDYANLCFTRPASWTRSSILHAGLAKQNDIEINPPTGTILRFEAISSDTNTPCESGYQCSINTIGLTHLKNDLTLVSGVFNTVPLNPNVTSGHTPFVQLISSSSVNSYGLKIGKNTSYTTFNPGVSFNNAPKVMMQIFPGKGFAADKALQWLSSSEGTTSKQVLASIRSR